MKNKTVIKVEACNLHPIDKKKMMKLSRLLKIVISAGVFSNIAIAEAQQLNFLGDSNDVAKKYCTKAVDITQQAADELAASLQVPSDSIRLRRNFMDHMGILCCTVVDTPKGPISRIAGRFYQSTKTGRIIVGPYYYGVRSSDPLCQ